MDFNQPSGRKFTSAALVDVDLDGDLDLVLGAERSVDGMVLQPDTVLINDGAGNFSEAPAGTIPARPGGSHSETIGITAGDFNGDGWPDLVLLTEVDYTQGRLQLVMNNGDGTFREASSLLPDISQTYTGGAPWPIWVYAADLNADGREDMVVVGLQMSAHVLTQMADGSFARTRTLDGPSPSGAPYTSLLPADLAGDGVLDPT